MNLRRSVHIGLAVLAVAALGACAAPTQLTSDWSDPNLAGKAAYKKVVVVGITPKAAGRRAYEDAFAAQLSTRGIDAIPSYTFGGSGQIDKDAAIAKLKEIGADGVLVTRLIDKETVQNYYPPTYASVPSAYYGGWYGYYSTGYSYMYSPGYVEENKVYRLETNFYDVNSDKLVWSGLTETTLTSGDAPESEMHPLINTLMASMEKHHIIPPPAKK
ncbi:MAG TPA: hypothetical protein VKF80_02785 [Candidatus Eisenbacteria bacterium]|nr:hypothetical protein [Candidatus Eisenbacteria bacterium]